MIVLLRAVAVLLAALAPAAGCGPRAGATQRDGEPVSVALAAVEFRGPGIRLLYPGGWSAVPSDEFVLRLVQPDAVAVPAAPWVPAVSLDVPDLPPHIPGLIPIGLVVNGYADDMKKRHPGVRITDPVPGRVAGANARWVRSTWHEGGETCVEQAVLAVRGDRVYIFRANASTAAFDVTRPVLNSVLGSVRWE